MNGTISAFIGWASPIVSTLIVAALTAQINLRSKREEEERAERHAETDAKRKAEAEWRERIEARITEQDEKIDAVLKGQCTQMRSDLIHRAHRYVDDLHAASTEEKEAFWAEYEDYVLICDANNVVNHFIDELAKQVMALPNRDIQGGNS